MDTRDTDPNQISKLTDYKKGYQGYQNRKGNNNRSRKYQPLLCYICEKPGHFARDCRNQFCQRCGQKDHAMKNCNNSVSSYNVADRQLSSKDESVPEETVVIKILIEGHERNAMIDSGASVSVIDGTTVKNSNVKINPEKCSLRAFDNSVVGSPGFVQMNIQVGSELINHKFKVIEAKHGKEVIVLGREFQQKFSRTVFDWEQQRVALGDQWFDTIVWIRGGNMESRISAAGQDQTDSITEFDFDINPDLPEEQQDQLRELLIEFSDRFAKDTKKPTLTNVGEYVIETTPGARPVKCKKYCLSPEQEEEVKRQANKMVEDGVARPSNSPWAHNVILVKKKDGTQRFVVDYRELNKVTVKNSYPMPEVREIIDKMNGSKYFSEVDMASAYWAVPIRESDRHKTAFMTPRGLLEMCETAYGLCNSQATYQRIIDNVTEDVEQTESFVDDVASHTQSFQEMLVVLRQLFMKLREANLQLRADKCKFGYYDIDFVGLHLSGNGVEPIRENVDAITDFPVPTTKKELERFLGMAGYYRQFVPTMSDIAEPLNRLRKKGQPFIRDDDCNKAFGSLKEKLANPPVLAFPDWKEPFYIETDSSDFSVGGTLSQLNTKTETLQPIGYFSNALQPSERNYSPGEKECRAILAASRKWRLYYRAAAELIFITDHEPLEWLLERKDSRGKYARWILELEALNYEIISRNGLDHVVPDCLGRASGNMNDKEIQDEEQFFDNHIFMLTGDFQGKDSEDVGSSPKEVLDLEKLKSEQALDDAIVFAITQLKENNEIRQGRYKRFNRMHLKDDMLMRGEQIIVPTSM